MLTALSWNSYLNFYSIALVLLSYFLIAVLFFLLGGFLLGRVIHRKRDSFLQEQLQINQALENQNKEIQEVNRLKNEFLASMSHELRTPLNAIIGFSELLYDQSLGPLNKKQRESLEDIINSSKLLLEIISDLLDLAKVESGKMAFNPQPVNLEGLGREVLANVEMLYKKKRINLVADFEPKLGTVYLDPARLTQVMYNLLSNAHKFTPEFGSVEVRVKRDRSDYFRLEVEDNGIGIRPENIKKLFKSFTQLESGSSRKYGGTGLGLALTKQIVEAQGGSVGVFSSFGKGSIFYVILPIEYQATRRGLQQISYEKPYAVRVREQSPLNTKRRPVLLVMDNDILSLKLLQKTIHEKNYNLSFYSDPEQGLAAIFEQSPDLIVLDLFMPVINGFEILRRLAKQKKVRPIPVIIWTAFDLTPSERKRLGPLVQAVVVKGAVESMRELVEEIEKVMKPLTSQL